LLNECGFIIDVDRSVNCSKIPFRAYYICFVVSSGRLQDLPPCLIIKSSIWCLEENWN